MERFSLEKLWKTAARSGKQGDQSAVSWELGAARPPHGSQSYNRFPLNIIFHTGLIPNFHSLYPNLFTTGLKPALPSLCVIHKVHFMSMSVFELTKVVRVVDHPQNVYLLLSNCASYTLYGRTSLIRTKLGQGGLDIKSFGLQKILCFHKLKI